MTLKHNIRMLARQVGLDINRYDPVRSQEARLLAMLNHHGIDAVIDVGANDGGYGNLLCDGGYGGRILSFEPLTVAHALLEKTAKERTNWFVAPRMALGAEDSETTINIAGNSRSSSLLSMESLHREAAPQSDYIGSETVDVRRLDRLDHSVLTESSSLFLKIDTQGYEMPVLLGAENLIHRIQGIQLELTLVPLYSEQTLYRNMISWITERGFDLWNIIPGFSDPRTGRMLQMDGIFFRACK